MKKYLLILSAMFFISCREKKQDKLLVISHGDTIEITGYGNIYIRAAHCGIHGHNDTLTGIESIEFTECDTLKKIPKISFDYDTLWLEEPTQFDSISIDVSPTVYPISYSYTDTIPKPDSAKLYWKNKVLYEALFNQELERLNRRKKPEITEKLLRFQDSSIKYKLLLEKIKK